MSRYFVSMYTDGPATRWNVIDSQTQEWVCRFPTKEEAQGLADKLGKEATLKRATEIVLHGRTTTYPSISSAEEVRNVMAELVTALREPVVPSGVYESAVKGRSDFREAYSEARQEAKQLRDFVSWVDAWVSNPVGSYSYPALAGLFSQTRENIALLTLPPQNGDPEG